MTDVLLVGDVHLRDRPPISRTATYKQDILDKLIFCVEYANEHSLPIVQAGDMFDIKNPSKNSHRLVQDVHEILSEANNGVWIVPGNHDMSGDRLDSLESQPLGSLCRMRNVELLIGETDDLPDIAGIPYLSSFDQGSLYWPEQLRYNQFDLATPELLVTHGPFFPPGKEPGVYNHMSLRIWSDIHCGIPATYYGHIHETHGTFTSPDGEMLFCNQGALSRGSLHESNLARKPAITIYSGGSFTRVEVPHKASEEVFLIAESIVKKANTASAADFASALGQVQISRLTLAGIRDSLRGEVTDPEILTIIDDVLENLQ